MDWLTVKQASEFIGKHPDTIRAFYRKHKSEIRKDKNGRILIPKVLIEKEYGKGERKASKRIEIKDDQIAIIELLKERLKKLEEENDELKKTNQKNTEKLMEIIQQVNVMNGFVLRLEAENQKKEEESKRKKHWWSRRG